MDIDTIPASLAFICLFTLHAGVLSCHLDFVVLYSPLFTGADCQVSCRLGGAGEEEDEVKVQCLHRWAPELR